MDELYIKLRKHVYERLDIGRDVADSELSEVIDACIYEEWFYRKMEQKI